MFNFIYNLKYSLKHLLGKGINTPINDGLIVEKQKQDLGWGNDFLSLPVILSSGDGRLFLPSNERQSGRNIETLGCTGYAFNNHFEIQIKIKHRIEFNKSDRFINEMTGTNKNGNSMNVVIKEVSEQCGEVDEKEWPWIPDTFTWNEYYKHPPANLISEGKEWIKKFKIRSYPVPQNHALMKEAIKRFGSIYACGYAWYLENSFYRSYGRANHCFIIVGYDDGKCWYVFDSYSPFVKKLAWDYLFGAMYGIDFQMTEKPINFYKENGSYYTIYGQKIYNLKQLAEYAKNGGKEVPKPNKK